MLASFRKRWKKKATSTQPILELIHKGGKSDAAPTKLDMNPELRQQVEEDSLCQEIQLVREEIRIKNARMEQLEAHRRPHYRPTARLAILEIRAARGWILAQTARIFLVSPLTIASWMGRLD